MRLIGVAMMLSIAGCLGSHEISQPTVGDPSAADASGEDQEMIIVPPLFPSPTAANSHSPSMHRESSYTFGLDLPSADGKPCEGPALTNCDQPRFRLHATYDVEATLTWSPGSDLDLYLYEDDVQLSADGVNDDLDPLSTTQILRYEALPAGDYSMWVTVRHGAMGNYTLDVVFSTP